MIRAGPRSDFSLDSLVDVPLSSSLNIVGSVPADGDRPQLAAARQTSCPAIVSSHPPPPKPEKTQRKIHGPKPEVRSSSNGTKPPFFLLPVVRSMASVDEIAENLVREAGAWTRHEGTEDGSAMLDAVPELEEYRTESSSSSLFSSLTDIFSGLEAELLPAKKEFGSRSSPTDRGTKRLDREEGIPLGLGEETCADGWDDAPDCVWHSPEKNIDEVVPSSEDGTFPERKLCKSRCEQNFSTEESDTMRTIAREDGFLSSLGLGEETFVPIADTPDCREQSPEIDEEEVALPALQSVDESKLESTSDIEEVDCTDVEWRYEEQPQFTSRKDLMDLLEVCEFVDTKVKMVGTARRASIRASVRQRTAAAVVQASDLDDDHTATTSASSDEKSASCASCLRKSNHGVVLVKRGAPLENDGSPTERSIGKPVDKEDKCPKKKSLLYKMNSVSDSIRVFGLIQFGEEEIHVR